MPTRRIGDKVLVLAPDATTAELRDPVLDAGPDPPPRGARVPVAIDRPSARLHLLGLRAPDLPGGPSSLGHDDASRLLAEARRGRVVPQLQAAVEEGALEVPAPVRLRLLALNRTVQEVSLQIERAGNDAISHLRAAGIEPVVLKGLATGHLDHPSPDARQIGDVDLLVASADLRRSAEVLVEEGGVLVFQSGEGAATRSLTVTTASGIEVDLHRLPTRLRYGRWVLERPVPTERVEVSTVGWSVLPRPDRFVHAVVHYLLSSGDHRNLSSAVDAIALWPREGWSPGWTEAIERWRAATLVGAFAALVRRDFGVVLPHLPGCETDRARWYERDLIRDGTLGPVARAYLDVGVLPRSEALRVLLPALLPSSDHLRRSPHRSRVERLAHGVRAVVSGRVRDGHGPGDGHRHR